MLELAKQIRHSLQHCPLKWHFAFWTFFFKTTFHIENGKVVHISTFLKSVHVLKSTGFLVKKGSGQSGQMMRSSSFPVSQRKEGRRMPVKLQNQRWNKTSCKTLKTITNIHWVSVNCRRNAYGHSFNDTQYSRTNKPKQPSMRYHFLL